ncbi:MAG: DUF1592 domain-containing protein [Archangiaceae bacterium]|nr:DUF1592 domain-containing protein [Archangiaceae bacterium]
MPISRAVLATLVLTACEGSISAPVVETAMPGPTDPGPGPGAGGPAPLRYSCDPAQVPLDLPLRRLSKLQYVNTLQAAALRLAPAAGAAALAAAAPKLALYPDDEEVAPNSFGAHGFTRADQRLSQQQADAAYAVATTLADALAATAEARRAIFGACAADATPANDVACAKAWLTREGSRLLRAPLDDAQASLISSAADAARGDGDERVVFGDVLATLFLQPAFGFALERRGDGPSDPAAQLDAYALASRLAYHLTDAPPDDTLWAAASSGTLTTDVEYRRQVARLLDDPRSLPVRDAFFDQWLWLSRGAVDLTQQLGVPAYRALSAEGPHPTHDTRAAILEDALGAARRAFDTGAGPEALLRDTTVYTSDPEVQALYGSAPLPPPGQRAGLLTRLAFTANGRFETNPIIKGVRVRSAVLCDVMGAPPPGAANAMVSGDAVLSSREKTEALTEVAGTPCVACHQALINPLGFLTEGFDPLGRWRTVETVYDAQGNALKQFPVRTAAAPRLPHTPPQAADAHELTDRIAASGKFEACVAAQLFRFTAQKPQEEPTVDGCRLSELERLARSGASFRDLFQASVTSAAFRRRVTAP